MIQTSLQLQHAPVHLVYAHRLVSPAHFIEDSLAEVKSRQPASPAEDAEDVVSGGRVGEAAGGAQAANEVGLPNEAMAAGLQQRFSLVEKAEAFLYKLKQNLR